MVTGFPVTSGDGETVLFQILWEGKTERTHRRLTGKTQALMRPAIYHDHAFQKTQTHATFERFMKELDGRLAKVKAEYNLPPDRPVVLLIDNVSSHVNKEELCSIKSQQVSPYTTLWARMPIY